MQRVSNSLSPTTGQLIEQGIGLRLRKVKLLEKGKYLAGLLDRQPEAVNLISKSHQGFDSVLAATHQPWRFAEVIPPAKNVVRHQDGSTVLQPPRDTGTRKFAGCRLDTRRINLFRPLRKLDLVGGRKPSSSQPAFASALLSLPFLLSLSLCFL